MTPNDVDPPTLAHGDPEEQCAECGSLLSADQRYCLNCGSRRTARRVPVEAAGATPLQSGPRAAGPVAVTEVGPSDGRGLPGGRLAAAERLGGAWGVAALLLVALGVGVVIGNLGGDEAPVAARPPVVTIAAGALGQTAAPTAPVADTTAAADEWPDRDGFTVQLGELPKAGTGQAAADAAKAAASAKGAAAVGVLDAGAHGLTTGQLVVYSGVFETRKQARAALGDLKAAYPAARVIEVKASNASGATKDADSSKGDSAGSTSSEPTPISKSRLKDAENLDPEAFQKQSKKLPKTTALPGKPPPKDDAAPGGGSDAETIG